MASRAKPSRKTLLLVEDDTNVLKLLSAVLEKAGYEVIHATDPEHAVWLCTEYTGDVHLLVTDVVMPGMNGLRLSLEVQKRWPEVGIVLVSGHPDAPSLIGDALKSLTSPLCFVPKPVDPDRLLTALRSLEKPA